MLFCAQRALDNWRQFIQLALAELLAGDVEVVPEVHLFDKVYIFY